MKRAIPNNTWGIQSIHNFESNNVSQIIPVTLFLVMLYNAFFTYQDDKSKNLLIRGLDRFNLGSTVDDNTFMNTFGEFAR